MNRREFYDYIVENFSLGGTGYRLVSSILEYASLQDWDDEELHRYLAFMLDGVFGLERHEIEKASF